MTISSPVHDQKPESNDATEANIKNCINDAIKAFPRHIESFFNGTSERTSYLAKSANEILRESELSYIIKTPETSSKNKNSSTPLRILVSIIIEKNKIGQHSILFDTEREKAMLGIFGAQFSILLKSKSQDILGYKKYSFEINFTISITIQPLEEKIGLSRRNNLQAFVSYVRSDQEDAECHQPKSDKIEAFLRNAKEYYNIECIYDARATGGGGTIKDSILWSIDESDVFFALDEGQYFERPWPNQELGYALAKRKPIIGVLVNIFSSRDLPNESSGGEMKGLVKDEQYIETKFDLLRNLLVNADRIYKENRNNIAAESHRSFLLLKAFAIGFDKIYDDASQYNNQGRIDDMRKIYSELKLLLHRYGNIVEDISKNNKELWTNFCAVNGDKFNKLYHRELT